MGQDPREVREEIEETRARMGETVDAIGYKADVKSRARDAVSERTERARSSVAEVTSKVTGRASEVRDRAPSAGQAKQGAQRAAGVAQENPLGLALGSVAVGFLAGMLIPSTRVEHEKVGPVADQVKDAAKETGQEALERGRQVAQEAAQAATETAKESGQEQAEQLRGTAQERAQQAGERAQRQSPGS